MGASPLQQRAQHAQGGSYFLVASFSLLPPLRTFPPIAGLHVCASSILPRRDLVVLSLHVGPPISPLPSPLYCLSPACHPTYPPPPPHLPLTGGQRSFAGQPIVRLRSPHPHPQGRWWPIGPLSQSCSPLCLVVVASPATRHRQAPSPLPSTYCPSDTLTTPACSMLPSLLPQAALLPCPPHSGSPCCL